MRYALTSERVYAAERRAVDEAGVTFDELMSRAGEALESAVAQAVPTGPVVVLAGPGNNGGDGWTVARLLAASGLPGRQEALRRMLAERVVRVTVKPFMDISTMIEERLTQQDIADRVGASREMVARILKDLAIGDYIAFEGKNIIINGELPTSY